MRMWSTTSDGDRRMPTGNPKRYESNLDKNYDSKNMMHCFRLMHMAGEIAEGKGMILQRTWDRQFLMDDVTTSSNMKKSSNDWRKRRNT